LREQTIRAIELAAGMGLFLVACLYAVNMLSVLDSGLTAAAAMTEEQNAGVSTFPAVSEAIEPYFQGSEVLFTLRDVQAGRYEAVIDGLRFAAGTELEAMNLSVIDLDGRYMADYHRGSSGAADIIRFDKVR